MRAGRSRSVAHGLRAARTRHYMSPRKAGRKTTAHELKWKFSRPQSDHTLRLRSGQTSSKGGLSGQPLFVPSLGLGFVMHAYPAPRRWATIFRPAKRDSVTSDLKSLPMSIPDGSSGGTHCRLVSVGMAFGAFVFPLQELTERCAAVAVFGFLFGGEFREGFADLREIEQRIVAEAIATARCVQNETFSAALKRRQSVSIAGHCNHADKAAGAVFLGNIVELTQQASIVRLVAGIGRVLRRIATPGGATPALLGDPVVLIGGVACRANPGRAAERVNLQP